MMRRLAVLMVCMLALSGCGLRGKLERPAPLFGAERATYEAEQKRKAEAEAAAKAGAAEAAASGERQRTEIPVAPAAEPEAKAPETLQPTPPTSPFQRPN